MTTQGSWHLSMETTKERLNKCFDSAIATTERQTKMMRDLDERISVLLSTRDSNHSQRFEKHPPIGAQGGTKTVQLQQFITAGPTEVKNSYRNKDMTNFSMRTSSFDGSSGKVKPNVQQPPPSQSSVCIHPLENNRTISNQSAHNENVEQESLSGLPPLVMPLPNSSAMLTKRCLKKISVSNSSSASSQKS